MLLQSASLSDYKMADIWSLGMTLFCMLHPDLGSPFLIELSETGFDVHRNIDESLSKIILKNKRPKSSTKYQNTLINHWLNMWFALSQCLKINPCEMSSQVKSSQVNFISDIRIYNYKIYNFQIQK